jgi:hypothetical protein
MDLPIPKIFLILAARLLERMAPVDRSLIGVLNWASAEKLRYVYIGIRNIVIDPRDR